MVFTDTYLGWAERWDRYAPPGTRARAYADCVMGSVLRPRQRSGEANTRVLRALDLARRLEEPEVLFRAAASMMFPGWQPQYLEEQRRLAYEITARPRQGVRTSTLALALQRAQTQFLAAGDRDGAEQVWRELEQLATHTRDVVLLLWPLQLEAIRATLDGNLEGAVAAGSRLTGRAAELGVPVAGEGSAQWLTFQPLLSLGRPDEALPVGPWSQKTWEVRIDYLSSFVVKLTHQGRSPEALENLKRALAGSQARAEAAGPPAHMLASLLEAAVMLSDVAAASFATDQFQDVVAIALRDLVVFNVARHLGGAAALLGEPKAARREYQRSLDWAVGIRHRPEIALTRLAMAELLLDDALTPTSLAGSGQARSQGEREQERAEGLEHLDFAIAEFREMKMQPALERALRHKGLLTA